MLVRGVLFALLAVAGGCAGETSLLLELDLASGRPQPVSLRVTRYGDGHPPAPSLLSLDGRTLPGTVVVGPLDAGVPGFRIVVDGLDGAGATTTQAAARVTLQAGAQTAAKLLLDGLLADADGDGVPDLVDDCPTVFDPEQRCAAPDLGTVPDGSPAGCPGGAIFCDDFETGNRSKWADSNVGPEATLTVVAGMGRNGTYALRATSDMPPFLGTNAFVEHNFDLPSPSQVAVRAWMRFQTVPARSTHLLELSDGGRGILRVGTSNSGNWAIDGDNNLPDRQSTTPLPTTGFACVELLIDMPAAGATGRIRLFVDGAAIVDEPVSDVPTPDRLRLGPIRAPSSSTCEVLIDDVALGASPIGCN